MKKKLLLIYGKGSDELLNRQSALGSYILCLLKILEEKYEIWVNGTELSVLLQKEITVLAAPPVKSNLVKKLVPGFLKERRRDNNIFSGHENILSSMPQDQRFDLVMEFYTYGSRLGLNLSKRYACPLVTIFDSPVLEEYEFFHGKKSYGGKTIQHNQDDTLRASSKVVVYSNAVKEYVAGITQKPENIFIHQNVDFTRFDFLDPKKMGDVIQIGFIGSFLKWHRVDLLINIFEKLRASNIQAKLWLVGSGMEFHSVRQRVETSEFGKDIELTGFCDGEKLLEIKKQLNIGVMPGSNWYGAPNKIFEYGAAGLAVIAPATPTISDLFENGKELLLFEWDNEKSAYAALYRLCTEKTLQQQLSQGLQEKIQEKYSADHTRNFYHSLLSGVTVVEHP